MCPKCHRRFDNDDIERCRYDNERLLIIAPDKNNLVGTVLVDRFALTDVLGIGGFATVYSAIQEPVGRQVAVKVLLRERASDEVQIKRFINEAKSISKLRNQHTIQLFDFGQAKDGSLFMAMEFSPGVTLSTVISEEQPLDPGRVAYIGCQVCESLAEAHEKGIIHRDLKPTNIMLETRLSGADFVKVLDFGIAKLLVAGDDEPITTTGTIAGTPTYMAPEQIQSRPVTPETDLYALGVVLFKALTGTRPIDAADAVTTLMAQINNPPLDIRNIMPDLPAAYGDLVMSLLEKDPKQRPSSAEDVRIKLAEFAKIPTRRRSKSPERPRQPSARVEPTPETISAKRTPAPKSEDDDGPSTPVQSMGVFDSSISAQLDSQQSKALPVAVAIAALAAIVLFIALYSFGDPKPEPLAGASPTTSKTVEGPQTVLVQSEPARLIRNQESATVLNRRPLEKTNQSPAEITLTIKSPGAPATVKLNKEILGKTPVTIQRALSNKIVTLTVHRPGYNRARYKIALNKDQIISVAWRFRKRQNATVPKGLMGPDD